jgi:phage terminase large subunit-like protein
MMQSSDLLSALRGLSPDQILEALAELSDDEAEALLYDWKGLWARGNQIAPPGAWFVWLLLAGRGFGKSRTGAEWVRERVEVHGARRIALVGPTAADVRDVMVEGESGLLAVCPPWNRPIYEPSKRRLTWPNGAIATCYSAEEPARLRGPQHDTAWCDEKAAWRYARDTWDNLIFGLRLGSDPRVCVTTTPRPTKEVRELVADPDTIVVSGSTYDNEANLAPRFLAKVRSKYEGTRLGRQELHAEILDDNPGALWKRKQIEDLMVRELPPLIRKAVAVDPAVSAKATSDETGIVAGGIGWCSCKGYPELHGFVIDDVSGQYTPAEWAELVVNTYEVQEADRVVAEVNNGGDLVEANLRTVGKHIPYKAVHASRGKQTRAEPIAGLYEQRKVHHLGSLALLEDQMCNWDPTTGEKSPDRLDALVWLLTELMLELEALADEVVEYYDPVAIGPDY